MIFKDLLMQITLKHKEAEVVVYKYRGQEDKASDMLAELAVIYAELADLHSTLSRESDLASRSLKMEKFLDEWGN